MGLIRRSFEQRDSLGNPSKWLVSAFGGGTETASGIRVNEQVSLRNLTIWSCVRILSETLAQLPLPVYRRDPNGVDRERAMDDPLYPILNRMANTEMTAFTFREILMGHLALWGNAYAEIERNQAGDVMGLWPLLPDRTKPMRMNGQIIYQTRIKRDPNGVSPDDDKLIYLNSADVLHIPGFGFDGLKGYSPISLAREAVALGMALEEYAARFFGNGAIPGFVLQTDKNLGNDQRKALEAQWQDKHQGLSNAQRTAILENGLKVQTIGLPPGDAQFLDSRKFSRNELASIFRIPPHMIGDVERSTSWGTGIEQQAIGFVVYTMQPWATRWEQAINAKLIDAQDQDSLFSEFLMDGLVRGDITARYGAYNLGFGKWLTSNDIRRKENLNSWADGDQPIVPNQLAPLDKILDGTAIPGTAQTPADGPAPNESQPSAASAPAYDHGKVRRSLATAHRIAFQDVAERVLRRERTDIVRGMEKTKDRAAFLDGFYKEHRQYTEKQMAPAIQTYAEAIRGAVEAELGREVTIPRAFVTKYIASFAARHSADSLKAVGTLSAPELEAAFGTSSRRAERIAQKESVQAGNAIARAIYKDAGVSTLVWSDSGDCPELNGRSAPVDGEFAEHMSHPPRVEGCECVVLAPRASTVASAKPEDPMLGLIRAIAAKDTSVNVHSAPITVNPPPPIPVNVNGEVVSPNINIRVSKEGETSIEHNTERINALLDQMTQRAQKEEEMRPEEREVMLGQTKVLAAIAEKLAERHAPQPMTLTVPEGAFNIQVAPAEVKIMPGAVQVNNLPPTPAPKGDLEIVYDKNGRVKGTRRVKEAQ